MKIEHVAFNVEFPLEMTAWYVEHLKMRVLRAQKEAPFTHFLCDESQSSVIEIYHNKTDPIPDYAALHPLRFHLAFVSTDPGADRDYLLRAGASVVEELHLEDGSHLIMMRDPWGLAIQLCKRGKPLFSDVV